MKTKKKKKKRKSLKRKTQQNVDPNCALHAKNIIKEIIDYYRRTTIGDLNNFKKAIPSPILKREVLIPHVN